VIVRTLVSHGANPNLKGGGGMTPLMWAVRNGRTEVVRLLVAAGADVNLRNAEDRTALDEALELLNPEDKEDEDEVVGILKAAINAPTETGPEERL
jgi:ankyrin repeat protein